MNIASASRHLLLAIALWAVAAGAQAQQRADSPIQGMLEQNLVSIGSDGKEKLTPAERVKPGDLVEYRVRYTNKGNAAVNDFAVTLPIPAGLELIAQSDTPRAPLASTDGVTFKPVPLTRTVQRDGREVVEPVPLTEYRALRWQAGQLGAGKVAQFSARARVEASTLATR